MRGSIVVAGSIAQRPGYGGHTWALLQWVLGFRALGWSVLFLDRLAEDMCGERGMDAMLHSRQVAHFRSTVRRFGLEADASLALHASGRRLHDRTVGVPRERVLERIAGADLVLNVMGFLTDPELLGRARRRVFLDIDPGFGQMWNALGQHDPFAGHDEYVTIGLNVGRPACRIPTCGLDWVTTVPPVVMEDWTVTPVPEDGAFSTIGSWRGPYAPVEYDSELFGLRVHEFRRFIDLPSRTGLRFDAALDIDASETADLDQLRSGGWRLIEPRQVAHDPDAYAAFLRSSAAEFMVAKNMYVRSRSGWVSDRSIAFMASGRAVLAQDTGLAGRLPSGDGLVLFESPDQAAAGAAAIMENPQRHGRAARDLAAAHFEARTVLGALVDRLASPASARPAEVTCA